MKSFLVKVFTWWNSQTSGTQFWTGPYGEAVGEDEFGNRCYRTRGGKIEPALGFERRWTLLLSAWARPKRSGCSSISSYRWRS